MNEDRITADWYKERINALSEAMEALPPTQERRMFGPCLVSLHTLLSIKEVREIFSVDEAKTLLTRGRWVVLCNGYLGNKRTVYLGSLPKRATPDPIADGYEFAKCITYLNRMTKGGPA